jgi:hypothetical protein
MRILAGLLQPVEAETPYGGRSVTYDSLGVVWLAAGDRRRRERTDAGMVRAIETMTAETRADPRLTEGRVLRFGGADWAIVMIDTDAGSPGRVSLSLERGR